jgi:hypothetical protein
MKTMSMREFVRGGYKSLDELTLITNHGRPYATWMPQSNARKRSMPLPKKAEVHVDSNSPHPEHGA